MKIRKDRTGKKFINNDGEYFTIVEYFCSSNITVKFSDGTIVKNRYISNINKGICKNPNFKNSETFKNKKIIKNIGYLGIGKYTNDLISYRIWCSIINRCYTEYTYNSPTYVGCTVDERWHNFQVFAEWYENNYINGFQLDKDILIKGNKIYGPDTCCFVPREINTLFVKSNATRGQYPLGVIKQDNRFRAKICLNLNEINLGYFDTPELAFNAYKMAKENHIKDVANKNKDKLTIETYQAMYNYQVEITD